VEKRKKRDRRNEIMTQACLEGKVEVLRNFLMQKKANLFYYFDFSFFPPEKESKAEEEEEGKKEKEKEEGKGEKEEEKAGRMENFSAFSTFCFREYEEGNGKNEFADEKMARFFIENLRVNIEMEEGEEEEGKKN